MRVGRAWVLVLGIAACGPGSMTRSSPDATDAAVDRSDAPGAAPVIADGGTQLPAMDAGADEPLPEPPAADTLRIVQCNPYYAGRLDPVHLGGPSCARTADCAGSGVTCSDARSPDGCFECIDRRCRRRTWATAEDMVARVRDIEADVIGMQEIPPVYADRVVAILEDATGDRWDATVAEQGIEGRGSGVAVFWRETRVELVRRLGPVDVDTLDSGYVLRFVGAELRPLGSDRSIAVFSGKLYWERAAVARRGVQAERVRAFIDEVLADTPGLPRVLAIDLNDEPGSPAHRVFAAWDDGDAVKATAPGEAPDGPAGRRIDYLFWSRGGAAGDDGFATERSDGRLGRSGYFGSDHRFVYGDARVAVSP